MTKKEVQRMDKSCGYPCRKNRSTDSDSNDRKALQ